MDRWIDGYIETDTDRGIAMDPPPNLSAAKSTATTKYEFAQLS